MIGMEEERKKGRGEDWEKGEDEREERGREGNIGMRRGEKRMGRGGTLEE